MIKTLKKLYQNRAEIRDYDVQKCILKKENMIIIYNGEKMTLSPLELETNIRYVSKVFKSKMKGGKDYKLYGYKWWKDEE